MEQISYKYSTPKNKITALVLNVVAMMLATLASGAIIVVLGSISSVVISYAAVFVGSYAQGFAIVALVATAFLSCLAIKKNTRLTLPALIVTLIVYVIFVGLIAFNSVVTMQFILVYRDFDINWIEIALHAGMLVLALGNVVAWVLFIVGHRNVREGEHSDKLIKAAFGLMVATTVALFAVQCATNVINLVNIIDLDSQQSDTVQLYISVIGSFVVYLFGNLAILLVASAYYTLSRSQLAKTVVTLPTATLGKDQSVTLDEEFRQDIPLNIFLTIITLGIFGFVWFYRNAVRLRKITGEDTSHCVDELLLSILGGPLYRAYWYYTRTQKLNESAKALGYDGIFFAPRLYLLLAILTPSVFELAFLTANYNKLFNIAAGIEPKEPQFIQEPLELRYGLLKTVLLSIFTLGIYFVVMAVRLVNKTRAISGKQGVDSIQIGLILFVPFYWVYWLISRDEHYNEGSNEATLEAWMLLVMPLYSIYWLITRMMELKQCAEKLDVAVNADSIWSFLFAIFTPFVAFANMLSSFNKVSESIILAEVMQIRSGTNAIESKDDIANDSTNDISIDSESVD